MVIVSLPIYQPLLGFRNGDCTAPWEGNAYQHSPHTMLSSVPCCVLLLLYIFKNTSVFFYQCHRKANESSSHFILIR